MTTSEEEERRNILSKLPDELLQTKECKLEHSYINSTSTAAWRHLEYSDKQYGLESIQITITHKVNNSYYANIKVYVTGSCYNYYDAPKSSAYPHVDIAYQIANYLKILGLYVNDH